jgi:hypothetical protein
MAASLRGRILHSDRGPLWLLRVGCKGEERGLDAGWQRSWLAKDVEGVEFFENAFAEWGCTDPES